jgi:hypothetical protein
LFIENGLEKKQVRNTMDAPTAGRLAEREDLTTPSTLTAGYIMSDFGADLDAIEPFTAELTELMDKMKEDLETEARILEGTDVPEYDPTEQNERSPEKLSDEEWRILLLNGSSKTVRTLVSIPGLNTLSSSARPNSPVSPPLDCARSSCLSSTPSWRGISDGCGCATAAMNESSECTVPMISEPMPGTPSEEK